MVVSEGVTAVRRTPLGAFLRGPPSSVMVGGCNINPCQEQGGFGWPSPCFNVTFWHCCFLYLLPPLLFVILQVCGEKCQAGSVVAWYRRVRSPARFPQAAPPTDFSLHSPLLVSAGTISKTANYQMFQVLSVVWMVACRKPPKPLNCQLNESQVVT